MTTVQTIETFLNEFEIIIDSSVMMNSEKCRCFLDNSKELLRASGKKILLPKSVVNRLVNISNSPVAMNNYDEMAHNALALIEEYADCFEMVGDGTDESSNDTLMKLAIEIKSKLLFLVQDFNLAKSLMCMRSRERYIVVRRLSYDGSLSTFTLDDTDKKKVMSQFLPKNNASATKTLSRMLNYEYGEQNDSTEITTIKSFNNIEMTDVKSPFILYDGESMIKVNSETDGKPLCLKNLSNKADCLVIPVAVWTALLHSLIFSSRNAVEF